MKSAFELPKKLDLVKVRREMWELILYDWEEQRLINEIVAREINLIESTLNAIIDYLKEKENK